MPACTRFSMCQTISALPPASSSGLGVWSVSGRMRSPRPAAKSMALKTDTPGKSVRHFPLCQKGTEGGLWRRKERQKKFSPPPPWGKGGGGGVWGGKKKGKKKPPPPPFGKGGVGELR